MKRGVWLIFLLAAACSSKHSDPGFTSAEGTWTYTTPDSKIAVTFQLAKNGSGDLTIQNQTFKLNGTAYKSAAQISGVTLPTIQLIRINANDAAAVYNYNVAFNNCVVSTDFKTIHVPGGTYTWPWGTVKTLTDIDITRP